MMPTCYWKRCNDVGVHKIGVNIEFVHPYICDKHYRKLLDKLEIKE